MKQRSWMNFTQLMLFFLLTSLPSALAQVSSQNFTNVFIFWGRFLESIFQNEYAVFGIVAVCLVFLLYNMFVPLTGKIPIFAGEGGKSPANRYGRLVSLCMASLCTLSLFTTMYLRGGISAPREFLNNILGPFATYAGIIIALIFFCLTYFGFKDISKSMAWKRGMLAAGFALVVYGSTLAQPGPFQFGWFLVIFALCFVLPSLFSNKLLKDLDSGGGSGSKDKEDKKLEVTIEGKVVDSAGNPVSDARIALQDKSGNLIREYSAQSHDPDGNFHLSFTLDKPLVLGNVIAQKDRTMYSAARGGTSVYGRKLDPKKGGEENITGLILKSAGGSSYSLEPYFDSSTGRLGFRVV